MRLKILNEGMLLVPNLKCLRLKPSKYEIHLRPSAMVVLKATFNMLKPSNGELKFVER